MGPPGPDRAELSPEEQEAYDRVVARNAAYLERPHPYPDDHVPFLPSREEAARYSYASALLNTPLVFDHLRQIGVILRVRGDAAEGYSHADREWAVMVLSEELRNWSLGFYYGHMLDAVAVGVRPEAIRALRAGRDEELSRDELELATYVRQVVRGTVTQASYDRVEARLGKRGAIEYTAFVGFLLMMARLDQAWARSPVTEELITDLADRLVARTAELPGPRDRIPGP
jgi:hypothetical protein